MACPRFCGLGEDLLQRKVMVFTTGMIEFPSVCHVLFQLLDFMVARSKKQEKKNLLPYELEMV